MGGHGREDASAQDAAARSDSQYVLTLGRRLNHPLSVRASVTDVPLLEGGIPKSFGDGPFGLETDLWIQTAGPSVELTPAFPDANLTGGVIMDAIWNPGWPWAPLAHVDTFGIWGDRFDDAVNPFSKEFVRERA